MRQRDDRNARNRKLDRIDSNSAQKPFCCLAKKKKEKKEGKQPKKAKLPKTFPPRHAQ